MHDGPSSFVETQQAAVLLVGIALRHHLTPTMVLIVAINRITNTRLAGFQSLDNTPGLGTTDHYYDNLYNNTVVECRVEASAGCCPLPWSSCLYLDHQLVYGVVRRVALELGHYRVDRMIVHRLDMATSGVVVMARSDAALKELNRQVTFGRPCRIRSNASY